MPVQSHSLDTPIPDYGQPNVVYVFIGTFLALIGLTANISSCFMIGCHSRFRTPTLVSFACLAFADAIAILVRYSVLFFHTLSVHFSDSSKYVIGIFLTLGFVSLHSSCGHIVLVAFLRYRIVSRPLYGFLLRPEKILRYSLIVWIYSCALGVGYGLYLFYLPPGPELHIVEFCVGVYLLTGTIVPIVILQVRKVKKLKVALSKTRRVFEKNDPDLVSYNDCPSYFYSSINRGKFDLCNRCGH